jgi:hypothetical protein
MTAPANRASYQLFVGVDIAATTWLFVTSGAVS